MSWWSDLIGRLTASPPKDAPRPLPDEPYVFECRACGKVFDAKALRVRCPECDNTDVQRMG